MAKEISTRDSSPKHTNNLYSFISTIHITKNKMGQRLKWLILSGMSIGCTSDQIRSVAQSCLTLCDPMNRSTPGLPVHHQLPEFTETHVHRVSDAILPSHPLSSPSPPAPNPSQHMKMCSASLIIRKTQIKIQGAKHSHWSEWSS